MFESDQNIWIYGAAGSGKTFLALLIKKFYCLKYGIDRICNLATTKNMAVQNGGRTPHSYFKIGHIDENTAHYFNSINDESGESRVRQFINEKIDTPEQNKMKMISFIFIDEVSLLTADMYKVIDLFFRILKAEKDKPFGGIKVLFSGDPMQLNPLPYQSNVAEAIRKKNYGYDSTGGRPFYEANGNSSKCTFCRGRFTIGN
jgi:hypothetical protein